MLYYGLERTDMAARKTETGFTIIELLIAISVMGILVPTIAGLITSLNRLNDQARDMTLINSLSENKVEGLRSQGFSAISNGTYTFTNELPATIAGPKSATYTVTTPSTGMRQVELTFTYNDHGKQRTLKYYTYVGEVGVGQY